jgi:CO/xanthine dehydrogenase Mo-binding subunit
MVTTTRHPAPLRVVPICLVAHSESREGYAGEAHVYTTPLETHNPMEPHATIAQWNGDQLTLHDATQYVYGVKRFVTKTLGIAEDRVRII